MQTTITFDYAEQEQANMCQNINRLIRILDNVYDYAYTKNDNELKQIIDDYLGLKEK